MMRFFPAGAAGLLLKEPAQAFRERIRYGNKKYIPLEHEDGQDGVYREVMYARKC